MGRRRFHAAFILYKTLGYPELRHYICFLVEIIIKYTIQRRKSL
jgi:hypothetical protein